jgi:hypothetical protein
VKVYYYSESLKHNMMLIGVGRSKDEKIDLGSYWLLCDADNGNRYVTHKQYDTPEEAIGEYP